MYQNAAWYITIVGIIILFLVFGVVAMKSSGTRREYSPIQEKAYKIRKFYFITLVSILIVASVFTLRSLPYAHQHASAEHAGDHVKVVDVKGYQFYWEFSDVEYKVGDTVQFNVTSMDVNHGFGLYNEDGLIIAQTQAMPHYTNKLQVTFDKPGTYKVLCLEYCSIGHHNMIQEFEVKP